MIGSSNSSFIPRQDQSAVPNTVRRRRVFGLFNVLSSVALAVSLIVAGGTYVYKQQIIGKKSELSVKLAEQRKTLSNSDFTTVQNFDRRLRAAQYVVDNHLTPSRLFAALERSTLGRVEYSEFTYQGTPGSIVTLELTGIAEEFATIALQAQSYRNEPLLESALITDLSVANARVSGPGVGTNASTERVSFEVKTLTDPNKLRYDGSVALNPSATAQPIATAPSVIETVSVPLVNQ